MSISSQEIQFIGAVANLCNCLYVCDNGDTASAAVCLIIMTLPLCGAEIFANSDPICHLSVMLSSQLSSLNHTFTEA